MGEDVVVGAYYYLYHCLCKIALLGQVAGPVCALYNIIIIIQIKLLNYHNYIHICTNLITTILLQVFVMEQSTYIFTLIFFYKFYIIYVVCFLHGGREYYDINTKVTNKWKLHRIFTKIRQMARSGFLFRCCHRFSHCHQDVNCTH